MKEHPAVFIRFFIKPFFYKKRIHWIHLFSTLFPLIKNFLLEAKFVLLPLHMKDGH